MEHKIIKLYLSGVGSPTISKLLNISKHEVLKILNLNNLIDKKDDSKYDGFIFDGKKWVSYYICDTCSEKIEVSASEKYYLHRNLKKKKTCKPCSLKKQTGEGNPFFGKTHTNDSKEQISKSRKNKAKGNKNAMASLKNRKKVSKKLKEYWSNGKMDETREKLSNIMKTRHINGELNSYNRSKAEDEIINKLKEIGIPCEPSFRLEGKIFDIYVPSKNLLIEYNGDYWHCNPVKYEADYFNKKKNMYAKEIWEYDKNKLYLAEKNNYNCVTIWEHDYKKTPEIINNIIKKYDTN